MQKVRDAIHDLKIPENTALINFRGTVYHPIQDDIENKVTTIRELLSVMIIRGKGSDLHILPEEVLDTNINEDGVLENEYIISVKGNDLVFTKYTP